MLESCYELEQERNVSPSVCWQHRKSLVQPVGTTGETEKLLSLEEVVTIDDINMNTPTLFPVHSSPSVRCPDLTFYLSLG